ncbi:hypothetical protein BGZ96_010177 [Linnemannia gamsii]|uniref:NTF2-domain-containing protein n=1 Tax=Linnemannia gamsii TaxID=64522 RepID=A0ABQ7JVA8_9FUNG|nr:hypothetical protein BGZ96_010177 [Linnemannia gamsii]
MTATTSNASIPANGEAPSVASHEVGMMFVHEYYTFLNKEPARLHCFYNKHSTMSHGIQGEDTENIHAKIIALDFEDCKVLVSNVDSQTSQNGGIMIQVLGEMSNRGGPSQKFVQTFFLAEQPKGFYVLNDIFRYLKDDSDIEAEVVEEEQQQQQEPEVVNPPSVHEPEIAICPPAPVIPEPEIAICPRAPEPEVAICPPAPEPEVAICPPAPEPVVEEKKPAVEEKKAEKKHEHKKHDKKADKKETKKDAAKKDTEGSEKPKTPEPSKKQNGAPVAAAVTAETAAPITETPTPVVEAPAPVPAPAPTGPPKPKTWANLAANNLGQWGSQASAAKGSSVNIPQPAAPKPQVVSQPKPQQQQQQQQGAPHKANGRDEFFPIYVKGITDRVSEEQLREAFAKFGPVKVFDFTQKRNCAYVDFATAEAMHSALKQNKIAVGSEFVFAEERRIPTFQSNRPPRFQNGSGGINGHQGPQGGHRGGRPARGGFQGKPIQRAEKPAPTVAVN